MSNTMDMLRITWHLLLLGEIEMTDINVAETDDEDRVYKVPVVKAKTFLEIKSKQLPDHVYLEALQLGLKQILNRGQTKITKEAYPNAEALRNAAMEKAQETLEAMYAGKIRVVGGKAAGKVAGVVMTEARRIARGLVKEELKRAGVRISMVEPSEITKAANALIAGDPDLIKQAEEEIEKRAAKKVKVDVVSGIQISQKRVKAAEAKKAEKVLSAAKAGRVVTRARPSPNA
jgi:hypothetical protein